MQCFARPVFALVCILVLASVLGAQQKTFVIEASNVKDNFGSPVAIVGDVNGDDCDDVAVGAHSLGVVRVFSGKDRKVLLSLKDGQPKVGFGNVIEGAGDVNGDGRADILIGHQVDVAVVFSGRDGRVLHRWSGLGISVSLDSVGDVNLDGYDDVILGLASANGNRGEVRVVSGKDGTRLYTYTGLGNLDLAGGGVSDAGDVNGDGVPDFMFSQFNGLRVMSGATGKELLALRPTRTTLRFGPGMDAAGDVNADGIPDLLLYTLHPGVTRPTAGIQLHSGKDGKLLAARKLSVATESRVGDVNGDGTPDLLVYPSRIVSGKDLTDIKIFNSPSNSSVSSGGDLNGDGILDVVVGWNGLDKTIWSKGKVWFHQLARYRFHRRLYSHSAGGVAVAVLGDIDGDQRSDVVTGTPHHIDTQSRKVVGMVRVFSGKSGKPLFTYKGTPNSNFGHSVADAGDVNRDGVTDFIVGIPDTGGGKARVYSGRNGSLLHEVKAAAGGTLFGRSVAGVGDMNRDGHVDFAVGEPQAAVGGKFSGTIRVFSGRDAQVLRTIHGQAGQYLGWSIAAGGDVNRDRYPDLIAGSPFELVLAGRDAWRGAVRVFSGLNGKVIRTLRGEKNNSRLFGYSVANAGYVNGDGNPDQLVGDYAGVTGGGGTGRAYVFSGRDQSLLRTWSGVRANGRFGQAVAGAGDLDDDSVPDVLVGAPLDDTGGPARGAVFLLSGRDGKTLQTFRGSRNSEGFGWAVAGGADVDGDEIADIVVGNAHGSTQVYHATFAKNIATLRRYGHGCPDSNGRLPHIGSAVGGPVLGRPWSVRLTTGPRSAPALLIVGPRRQQTDLAAAGMPGCLWLTQPLVEVFAGTDATGKLSLPVQIPNDASLEGTRLFLQFLVGDRRANALGAVATEGAQVRFGIR